MTEYADLPIRQIPLPQAQQVGESAWRTTWKASYTPAEVPIPPMPPVPQPLAPIANVIALIADKPGQLRVEVLSDIEVARREELAYLSLVFQRLDAALPDLRIEGYENHPVLRLTDPRADPGEGR